MTNSTTDDAAYRSGYNAGWQRGWLEGNAEGKSAGKLAGARAMQEAAVKAAMFASPVCTVGDEWDRGHYNGALTATKAIRALDPATIAKEAE